MKESIEKYIKLKGLKMAKEISSGGLLSEPTYDRRIVYNLKDMYELNRQGFSIDESLGVLIFNAILQERTK